MRGFQDLALGECKARRLGHFAQRIQLLWAGFFVHAKQQRAFQADELFSGGDIGQHHEFFDQAVRVKAFGKGNRADLAILTQHDLAFGQVKFQRLARCAGAF